MSDKIKIGISVGDLNGIGTEIIINTLSDIQILELFTPVIYGSGRLIAYYKKALNNDRFNYNRIREAKDAQEKKVNLISIWEDEVNIEAGRLSKESGKYAFKSLAAAVDDLKNNKIEALVTAPINKEAIHSAEFNFPGHTEYLEKAAGQKALMLMLSGNLRVAVATGHIPLKEVAAHISQETILEKIKILNKCLKQDFIIQKPKIAVLGLNPHAGDNGLLGSEEKEIIIPAIEQAKRIDIMAYGTYSADAFFGKGMYTQFDAVLAMYHDQGLVPFKTLSFGKGVNYTSGLPFIRTSPDHGTAFDIAGHGKASTDSFRQAIYTAIDIANNRINN